MSTSTDPKQELHRLIDRLADDQLRGLYAAVQALSAGKPIASGQARPLTYDDIVLAEPIMPDDETADEMIATLRRWRQEGGYA